MSTLIIGSGLAGLSAAKTLIEKGITNFKIIEASNKIGGLVKSDEVKLNGQSYILDHGFQVILDSYPSIKPYKNSLKLGYFNKGAQVLNHGLFKLPSILGSFSPVSINNIVNKLRILSLLFSNKKLLSESLSKTKIHQNFSRPFFKGVFLDPELNINNHYFKFIFKRFFTGKAGIPEAGMQSLPYEIAKSIPKDHFVFNFKVSKVSANKVYSENGQEYSFKKIIFCTPSYVTKKLVPLKFSSEYHSVSTYYFSAKINSSHKNYFNNFLLLNPLQDSLINHIALLNDAQKNYASDGSLFSVNCIGENFNTDPSIIKEELKSILPQLSSIEFIKHYPIKNALPKNFLLGKQILDFESYFIGGDFTESPSIEGAIQSGIKAAKRSILQPNS